MFGKGNFDVKQSWAHEKNDKPNKAPIDIVLAQYKKKIPISEKKKDSSDMTDMIDEEITRRMNKNYMDENLFKKNDNLIINPSPGETPPHITKANNNNNNNNEILSSLASRLSRLELTNNNQRKEIQKQAMLIEKLQKENNQLKSQIPGNDSILKLKEQNEKMRLQILEMEKFLADYGLKWVGNNADKRQGNDEGKLNVKAITKDIDKQRLLYKINLPKEIDVFVLQRRIEELNMIIEREGIDEIVKDVDGAYRFKKKEPLLIAFYKNGMIIQGFSFFLYSSKDAQHAMQDILDGYFPTLLKQKYPKGTLFKFINKIDEDYSNKPDSGRMNGFSLMDEIALKPQSNPENLNNIPKNIIKDGKIISLKDDSTKEANNQYKRDNKASENMIPPGIIEVKTEIALKEERNELTDEEKEKLTTLKVRTEYATYTLIIKLLAIDTISVLYDIVQKYSETKNFEIICNYPPEVYPNDQVSTLDELGLFPNSVLQLKAKS